jgi:hypothetical protein
VNHSDRLERLESLALDLLAEVRAVKQPDRPAAPAARPDVPTTGWELFCWGQDHGALPLIDEYSKSNRLRPQVATWTDEQAQKCYRTVATKLIASPSESGASS